MGTWLSDTYPRAKKRYVCELCGRPINQGRRHLARRAVDPDNDHGPFTTRAHLHCEPVTKSWDDYDWSFVGEFQEFMENKQEYYHEPGRRDELLEYMKEEKS